MDGVTSTGGAPTVVAGPSRRSGLAALAGAAAGSLLLSPITAVWALPVGLLLTVAGLVVWRVRHGGRSLLLYAGAGVLIGTIPYYLLAAVQA